MMLKYYNFMYLSSLELTIKTKKLIDKLKHFIFFIDHINLLTNELKKNIFCKNYGFLCKCQKIFTWRFIDFYKKFYSFFNAVPSIQNNLFMSFSRMNRKICLFKTDVGFFG